MKISSLSRRSGVSVPTIKFYLREQLLPPGALTARNQAEYDETHLSRLRLIRLLTGIGMMSLASVREVLAAIDSNCLSPHGLAQVVNRALMPEHPVLSTDAKARLDAAERVDRFLDEIGWDVQPETPERENLVAVLSALAGLGVADTPDVLRPYVEAAERLATREIDAQTTAAGAAAVVAQVVLFEVAFAVMRRMAYTHYLGARAERDAA
ncbi:MerR family transcriptional regulator [Hamadaea sp. NPDC050747]|uniref:MerR family transcriptional regulator n=1 Tax=Hamadaea sp. NPDC050747 TaxID=3155789 RepID=UPI0033EBA5BF